MVLEPAECAARQGIRRRDQEADGRQGADLLTNWFWPTASSRPAHLSANEKKTLDADKLAKALEGFQLPPEVALMPDKVFYLEALASNQADAGPLYVQSRR